MKQDVFVNHNKANDERTPSGHGDAVSHPIQKKIDDSPRQRTQQNRLTQLQGASTPSKPNGLPSPLRTGIEALSGMDMGDVVVHRNSSKPAQLNALAYAQGNDIHLGPGQDRHLPHEAWHAVQQRQGRVRATTQLAGVDINDNGSLEREADVMGARALQMQRDVAGPVAASAQHLLHGATPLQLQNKHFPTRSEDDPVVARHKDAVGQVVSEVERRVDHARGLALNWHALNSTDTGYVGLWARTAKGYFEAPKVVPEFIHARFGYAIETLACGDLPSQHAGLSIGFQVSTGHTRPDIVLTHPVDGVVGWLDITSSDSANHILGKDGAGWRTKPFVYEVFYTPLSLPEVLTGLQDPVYRAWGEYVSSKNDVVHEKEEEQRTRLRNALLELQEHHRWTTGTDDAMGKQKATESLLTSLGMTLGRSNKQASRGALAVADINDGPFGYSVGGTKTDRAVANAFIKTQAAPEIEGHLAEIDKNYMEHYQDIIADHQDLPLVKTFYAYLNSDATNKIEGGTAVAATVQESDELSEAWESIRAIEDPRAVLLASEVVSLAKELPNTVDFQTLRDWSNKSIKLRNKVTVLKTVLEEKQHFLGYLKEKYGVLNLFSFTSEESNLVQALSEMPKDTAIALKARKYREDFPVITAT
jgi:hypothetical protein